MSHDNETLSCDTIRLIFTVDYLMLNNPLTLNWNSLNEANPFFNGKNQVLHFYIIWFLFSTHFHKMQIQIIFMYDKNLNLNHESLYYL